MVNSMLDILKASADYICKEGVRLIMNFSGLYPANPPGDPLVIINPYGDHFWNELSPEGKRIQTQLLPEIDRFSELFRILIQNLPQGVQKEIEGSLQILKSSIEQEGMTWWKTRDEAVDGFRSLIVEVISTIEEYCNGSTEDALAITDTNALIQNPDIEHWQFDDVERFTIVLTPTVLSELDRLKISHGNQRVREKASSVIRRIKEYRRRGSLHDGVVVIKSKIVLKSVAKEPNMSQSLSWFDVANADDRFLASSIEIMQADLGKKVFIVTGDINMQNKADMAGLPFKDVPVSFSEQERGGDAQ